MRFLQSVLFLLFGIQCFSQTISKKFEAEKVKIEGLYYRLELYDSAMVLSNKLIKSAKNEVEKAAGLMVKTNIVLHNSTDLDSGEMGLPIALEAAKILSKSTDKLLFQTALNNIAVCYVKRYNPKNAETVWAKSEKYTQLSLRAQTEPNLMLNLDFNDNFEDREATRAEILESIKYTKQNLKMREARGSKAHIMWRNHTLGKYYFTINKNFDEAEKYFKIALDNSIIIKDNGFRRTILSLLTHFAYQAKEYKKGIIYGNRNLEASINEKNELQELICRDELFLLYKALNQNDIAYKHKDRAFEINEKYLRQNESQRLVLMKEKNMALQAQINLNEALEKADRNRNFLLGIISFLVLTILTGIFYNRHLRKQNKQILEAHLKGQTTERQRVAIDLHDNLGSTISSIKYSLEAIDRSKMNEEEVAVQENLYSLLDKAYNDVRLLSHNLLPEEFEKKGLTETLTEFIRKINKASKIKFDLKIDENFGRQNHKIEFELYTICMELVNNIMKHSKATNAMIALEQVPPLGVSGLAPQPPKGEQIRLTVSDNGIGIFTPPLGGRGAESDGKGMKNVQARVDSIGGKWNVKAIEGEGVVNEIVVNC